MRWTDEQREAIEYRGDNILLAAAAGSGKTAVLVQRIIELISPDRYGEGERPADLSELLVLTFTDAAASEMRSKISAAVNRALDENPYDPHWRKQSLLIHSANISTIHSFCLNTLKSYIHLTKLPADFSLVSEEENSIMLKQALDDVLELYYSKIDIDSSFRSLALGYGGIKNDDSLRTAVLSLLRFVKSMAYPVKWLSAAVGEYKKTALKNDISETVWCGLLGEIVRSTGREVTAIYDAILSAADARLCEDHGFIPFFTDEAASIRLLFKSLKGKDYAEMRRLLCSFSFPKLKGGVRGAEGGIAAAQNSIKALRARAKKSMEYLCSLFCADGETAAARIARTYPAVRTLKNIVLTVNRRYTRMKRSKSYLDFNDLEHETLRLLADRNGEPTDAALTLRNKFREILIDEYQDTNNIQDTIFRVISRDNRNIFMVGDLKQSIYKFRNAVPELFSQKYENYARAEEPGHLIRLFRNFRSRSGVVNTANFIFRALMSRDIGDIDYTDEEYLIRGAEYPELPEEQFDTELHLLCRDAEEETEESSGEPADRTELEAQIAAKRIREITNGEITVFDKNTGNVRSAEYRDIVILMRNTRKTAPVFERVLSEYSIPVYTDTGRSYLCSLEVQTVLSYLQIIDNPRQDIPLIAVLRSPIWGFTPDELAQLRTRHRGGCFYDAIAAAAENGDGKSAEFVSALCDLRKRAEYTGIDRLIWHIYYSCGYYAYAGSLSRGTERQANLRLLFERAAEFEHTKLSGLFSFMNYIETIKSENHDLSPAKVFGENENVVRIMSIHKSKGLEFPVVILADTAHRFNTEDTKKSMLWHEKAGIGTDYTDTEVRVRYPSLPRTLAAHIIRREMLSEEMRLLYVALTRAREKLIITATFAEHEKNWREPQYGSDGKALPVYVRGSMCFRDWITAALMRHPDAAALREYSGSEYIIPDRDTGFGLRTFIYESPSAVPRAESVGENAAADTAAAAEEEPFDAVSERINYEYPNRVLSEIPVKMSVSEAKRMQSEESEYVPRLEGLSFSGMSEPGGIGAAERGTIVHFVLQYADQNKISSEQDAAELLDKMQRDGIITAAQAATVVPGEISRFFQSSLGQRMKAAERVEKEFSFYTETDAKELYGSDADGKILLQGTIDCFMISGGRVVLLDFKTDKVDTAADAQTRAENYATQMKYYQKGLREILKRPVDECYIYFLSCGEAVKTKIY